MRHADVIPCTLCGRGIPVKLLTEHHLLPRQRGGGPEHKVPMCRPCHGHIHAMYDNRTLEQRFASVDELRQAPELQKFVRFIRKQSPTSGIRSRSSSSRRRR